MRRTIATTIMCSVALVALVVPAANAEGSQSRARAASRTRVTFEVKNVNRTPVQCKTDGKRYTVRGWRYGPTDGTATSRNAVTLLLHGLGFGKYFFAFEQGDTYSLARSLARHGHTVVVIDRLGYDTSDHPNGFHSCIGGQADIANQVVRRLRDGHYGSRSTSPGYERVLLGGHSVGAMLAQIAAYSFHDVDGLVVMSYSDVKVSALAKHAAAKAVGRCDAKDPRSRGYVSFAPTRKAFKRMFFYPPAARFSVFWTAYQASNRDPCGDVMSFGAGVKADLAHLDEVTVPTLIMPGQQDRLFPPPGGQRQAKLFTGAPSVTVSALRATGHAITLHVTRLRLAKRLDAWLDARHA